MPDNSVDTKKSNRINRFADGFQKIIPDSLTVAFILLIVIAVLAVIFAKAPIFVSHNEGQLSIAESLSSNFWNLLAFSMQMCIIAILGNVFASSPPIKKIMKKLCQIPKSAAGAYILCAFVAFWLSFVNWAIGMLGAIVIGKEMLAVAYEKDIKIHAPAFIACVFSVSLVGWSAIGASPVLYASQPGYLKTLVDEVTASSMQDAYTVSEIVFTPHAMITLILSGIVCFLAIFLIRPKKGSQEIETITEAQYEYYKLDVETSGAPKGASFAEKMKNSIILQYIIVVLMIWGAVKPFIENGIAAINLNTFNYLMFTAALACCMRPKVFVALVIETVGSVWGFIVQYPIYAGIFGIIVGTNLDEVIAGWFLAIASENSWPSIAMLYSGFMNIFVPSGGSKFIIEAPYIIPVSNQLNTSIPTIILSYSYGDCGTNMLTPFWWIMPCAMFKIDLHKVYPYAVIAALLTILFYFIALFLW